MHDVFASFLPVSQKRYCFYFAAESESLQNKMKGGKNHNFLVGGPAVKKGFQSSSFLFEYFTEQNGEQLLWVSFFLFSVPLIFVYIYPYLPFSAH